MARYRASFIFKAMELAALIFRSEIWTTTKGQEVKLQACSRLNTVAPNKKH
jgi:hypothetical protein